MKYILAVLIFMMVNHSFAQSLQVMYDVRHTLTPKQSPRNFPSLYFEYFKLQDSGRNQLKPASFLCKLQVDAVNGGTNTGKMFYQVAESLRFRQLKCLLHLSLSGGLGVTEPPQYSFVILNSYAIGIAYPFQWKGGYFNIVLDCKLVPYQRLSADPLFTLYFYRGFAKYRLEVQGDFSGWTENRDHGDSITMHDHGKRLFMFSEPQCWWKFTAHFSVGTRVNIGYHLDGADNSFRIYPSFGLRWKP